MYIYECMYTIYIYIYIYVYIYTYMYIYTCVERTWWSWKSKMA